MIPVMADSGPHAHTGPRCGAVCFGKLPCPVRSGGSVADLRSSFGAGGCSDNSGLSAPGRRDLQRHIPTSAGVRSVPAEVRFHFPFYELSLESQAVDRICVNIHFIP